MTKVFRMGKGRFFQNGKGKFKHDRNGNDVRYQESPYRSLGKFVYNIHPGIGKQSQGYGCEYHEGGYDYFKNSHQEGPQLDDDRY